MAALASSWLFRILRSGDCFEYISYNLSINALVDTRLLIDFLDTVASFFLGIIQVILISIGIKYVLGALPLLILVL